MSRPMLGCIADDFTGATDLANNLVRAGLSAVQMIGVPDEGVEVDADADADAVIVALKSRTAPATQAVAQSLAALRWLRERGAGQIYFKYCSTFDSTAAGNIGPVAEALMDALNCDFTVATPAFPQNGRTVFNGHLFVDDVLLAESSMRDHPLTPMTDSNLVRVMQSQCHRKVGLIDHRAVAGGAAAVTERIAALRAQGVGLAIVDASSDNDLHTIAHAVRHLPLVTAGSGLAIGLAQHFDRASNAGRSRLPAPSGRRAIVAGSCSVATQRQVLDHLHAGRPAFAIDPLQVAAGDDVAGGALAWAAAQGAEQVLLIYSTASAEQVRVVQAQLESQDASGLVEQTLARVAQGLVARGVRQLVVAGGETSGACVQALGIKQLQIGPQIAPGVPWCYARAGNWSGTGLHLALKSGNFGSEAFFSEAFRVLA